MPTGKFPNIIASTKHGLCYQTPRAQTVIGVQVPFVAFRSSNTLNTCGILSRLSCPQTPEQNGVAERKHRHIRETGNTMLFHSGLSKGYWLEAFAAAVFLINRLPSPVLQNRSPFEVLFGNKPDYAYLLSLVWVCLLPVFGSLSEGQAKPEICHLCLFGIQWFSQGLPVHGHRYGACFSFSSRGF